MDKILFICGGRSAEHEISLRTAKSIIKEIDRSKFSPVFVGITRTGTWHLMLEQEILDAKEIQYNEDNLCKFGVDNRGAFLESGSSVVYPKFALIALHGTYGEDGTIQGMMEMLGLPYFGSGVLASSLAMDKDALRKLLFAKNHIYITPYFAIEKGSMVSFDSACKQLKANILFVKPNACGSSVGVKKVRTPEEFNAAVAYAFEFDNKVLIEKPVVNPKELECAVLGAGNQLFASVVGEIVPNHEYYSYEAKYLDPNGAELKIPSTVSKDVADQVQELSKEIFIAIGGSGLARVDFFLSAEGDLVFNEINTLPGFTSISMYPKLMEASGISYKELISRLIAIGIDSYTAKNALKLSPEEIG